MRRTFILSAKEEEESLQMTNLNLRYAFCFAKNYYNFLFERKLTFHFGQNGTPAPQAPTSSTTNDKVLDSPPPA